MPENDQNSLTQQKFHEGLAQFTEETLLPAMEKMMDDKLDEKLAPIILRLDKIEEELADIKERLDKIDKRTDEDIKPNYQEIEVLKKRIYELEKKVELLKAENA